MQMHRQLRKYETQKSRTNCTLTSAFSSETSGRAIQLLDALAVTMGESGEEISSGCQLPQLVHSDVHWPLITI